MTEQKYFTRRALTGGEDKLLTQKVGTFKDLGDYKVISYYYYYY